VRLYYVARCDGKNVGCGSLAGAAPAVGDVLFVSDAALCVLRRGWTSSNTADVDELGALNCVVLDCARVEGDTP
jgi:hypothetical protein